MSTIHQKPNLQPEATCTVNSNEFAATADNKIAVEADAYAEHCAPIDQKTSRKQAMQSGPNLAQSRTRHFMREASSKFIGTFNLVLFGNGSVAQIVLSNGQKGVWASINWA